MIMEDNVKKVMRGSKVAFGTFFPMQKRRKSFVRVSTDQLEFQSFVKALKLTHRMIPTKKFSHASPLSSEGKILHRLSSLVSR